MKKKTIAGLTLIVTVFMVVMFVGCSKDETTVKNKGVGRARDETPVKNKGIELGAHFEGEDISFDYPKDWESWGKASFDRMRSLIKSQGGDLIVMLKTKEEACVIQVVKQRNQSSFDSFYQSKKEVADRVTTEDIEIMGIRYVKYSVKAVDLSSNQKAVLGYAERQNGETGISYQLVSGGYEYDINFIYRSAAAAAKDEKLRAQVMHTFKITGTKE